LTSAPNAVPIGRLSSVCHIQRGVEKFFLGLWIVVRCGARLRHPPIKAEQKRKAAQWSSARGGRERSWILE
jgi:hypothetical protein